MSFFVAASLGAVAAAAGAPPKTDLRADAFAVLKTRCVKCHGPARQEAGLNLAVPQGLVRGAKSGVALVRGKAAQSLLWRRVAAGQMPPGEPMPANEKEALRRWIEAGAPGLPAKVSAKPDGDEHWAFQKLAPVQARQGAIDGFIKARLQAQGLTLEPEADRATLIRRVAFDLTGLPPKPEELHAFLSDTSPDAYARMVDRYLASPRYGERWGKYWLDAAGYADSNGYFNADTDRPLAYRYRDYVVRSINADKPWDQFLREQLAGDELAGYGPGGDVTSQSVELLEATHFLRNSQDGTDSSDGNPDERRADKYAVLEGAEQMIGSALLGITVQCARCHDHKFEPFSQRDYYQLQAVLYPAFNVEKWTYPKQREMVAATAGELASAEAERKRLDAEIQTKRKELSSLTPGPSRVLFADDFDAPGERLATNWSNTPPGDSAPAGSPPVTLDSPNAPGAQIQKGALRIHESGTAGDRAVCSRQAFDWAPPRKGEWVQASFDLVSGAEYVGYFIALHDFKNGDGNVLLDGNSAGQAAVHVGYPARSSVRGKIGTSGYKAGHRYGVRVTNLGDGKLELAQIVDGLPEPNTVTLAAADLPRGGFGFEYCCGRSFTVDNVRIEASDPAAEAKPDVQAYQKKRAELTAAIQALEAKKPAPPVKIAAVTDLSPELPKVPLLFRGDYKSPKESVPAAAPAALSEPSNPAVLDGRLPEIKRTTGRRLAFARWLTQPGSRAAGLLARVTVNRWWQHHFGTGIVATAENLGYSGALPTHPELLEYLAGRLVQSGWSAKAIHREILLSAAYRQSSHPSALALKLDEDNRLLSRFPLRRLDAEAVRDAMLAVSGELDVKMGGPYLPVSVDGQGEVVVAETAAGAHRRSLYLQQKRTQVPGLLQVFDAPSIVFNCTGRPSTTVPLQSLKLLNSAFSRERAVAFYQRLKREVPDDRQARMSRAWELAWGHPPGTRAAGAAAAFFSQEPDGEEQAWIGFCQMLLASNGFLYVE